MNLIKLPQTVADFKTCLSVNSDLELTNILQNPYNRSPVQENIYKYSGAALGAGRPLDCTIICVAGATGAGKSTLINTFFRDNTLCKTNAWKSETGKIVLIRKPLKVTEENPPILTQLNFMDLPGYFDTQSLEHEAEHHAQLKQFKESRIELAQRTQIPKPLRYCYNIPKSVYPNLTLFVVKATDNRIEGENSQFIKSLKLLRDNGGLVDTKKINLIVVVTRVMELGRKAETIIKKFEQLKTIICNAVRDTFGLARLRLQVIPIENDPEEYELAKRGDFYELPIKDDLGNNELSHYNLYQAMKECLVKNGDLLGRLCVAWYCNTECPDRKTQAEAIDTHIPINSRSIELSMDALKISRTIDTAPKLCKFQSLGYGFCPVTEKTMPFSPLEHEKREVVAIANSKFLIPAGISVFENKVSKSNSLTFFKKEEYEGHMHNSYGIDAGVRLVVSASSKGKWVEGQKGSEQQSLISQNHEIQVAALRLDDPIGHPKYVKFEKALESLPVKYEDDTAEKFRSFFSKWGSHLIYEQGIGGAVQLNCVMKASEITREKLREVQSEVSGVFKQLFAGAGHQHQASTSGLRSIGIDTEDIEICGGDPPRLPTLKSLNPGELVEWSESVSSEPAELTRTMKLFPYYNLIDGQRSEALRNATEDYLTDTLLSKVEKEFRQNEMANKDMKEVMEEPAVASCFPKGTSVFVDCGKYSMPIENLASSRSPQLTTLTLHGVNDKMEIGKFSNTKFCTFLDVKPEVVMDYIALTFANGKKLLVSEAHMIFQYIPEKQVVVGKQAKYFKIGEIAVYTDAPGEFPVEYPVVTKITREKHVGAYSPLTMSGTFLAEGFLVSSYANVNSFKVAQCALAPLKMWHITPNLKKLSKAKADDEDAVCRESFGGIHPYAKFLMAFRKSFTRHGNK